MAETYHNPLVLPDNLPVPQDDGAARHLAGQRLPKLALQVTDGSTVGLSGLPTPTTLGRVADVGADTASRILAGLKVAGP